MGIPNHGTWLVKELQPVRISARAGVQIGVVQKLRLKATPRFARSSRLGVTMCG